jgi:hypothetical protein
VRVDGQLVFSTSARMLNPAVAGFGLAYFTEQQVQRHLDSGALVRGAGKPVLVLFWLSSL